MGRGPDRRLAHARLLERRPALHRRPRRARDRHLLARRASASAASARRHRPLEPFNHPTDVAFAPSGDIYVSDGYADSKVHRFDERRRRAQVVGRARARAAASSSTRTRSGCCRTGAWSWSTGRTIGCRCSRRTGTARHLGRLQAAARHLGRRGRQHVRHRSGAVAHACCRPTASCWGAAGRSSTARTASGATRMATCFWRKPIRAGSRRLAPI